MAEHKHLYPIAGMSEVFDVSRSGYYFWMSRGPSDRAKENQRLLGLKKNWLKSGKTYGSPARLSHHPLQRLAHWAACPWGAYGRISQS